MFDGAQLYRNEALDASRDRLGDPANLFGLKSWAVPAFMTTLLVSVTVFISTAHYARKEAVSGAIAPADGVERAAAIRAGIVKQVFVVNGQHVR